MKEIVDLNQNWQIRQLDSHGRLSEARVRSLSDQADDGGEWIDTGLPAQVQEILLREGRIPDPAQIGKAEECLWVAESDWVYRRQFPRPGGDQKVILHCEGLDTLVDVYLNGKHLAFHQDQYLPLRLDVTDALEEQNVLLFHFHSPHKFLERTTFREEWEGKVRRHRIIRKTDEDFGSFLGVKPYFTPIGVYDDVRLEIVDRVEIETVDVSYTLSDAYDRATVTVDVKGLGERTGGEIQVTVTGPNGEETLRETSGIRPTAGGSWQGALELTVLDLDLWWPRGYGAQPLYDVTVRAVSGGEVRDAVTKTIGFRDLQMDGLFDFSINGKKVKLWGANLTPLKGISHCWDSERFQKLMDRVVNCNMTSLRAWGPGAPYNEELYDEADRRGILIWAEFFHTWGMYPDSDAYRALCRQEAEHTVRTLKHHPSIVLWCGGNENHMGAEMDFPGERFIGREIFEEDYRAVCEALDPERPYHPNSPVGGAFANDPAAGDSHSYTHIWYVPGEDYPVLFTENTRLSLPSLKTLKRLVDPDIFWPEGFDGTVQEWDDDPLPPSWMELTSGHDFAAYRLGPVEQFYDTGDTPEGLIYRVGAAHSLYIRRYVERYRRGRPATASSSQRKCMGHYLWKLNNTWPMIYSNVIDYYLEPTMSYYALRRAYAPVLLSFDIGDHIYLWLVNDTPERIVGTVCLSLFDPLANETKYEVEKDVCVPAGESEVVMSLDELGMFRRQNVLFARLLDEAGDVVARTNDFADMERHLKFPEASLSLKADGDTLEITTDRFARCVTLTGGAGGDEFGWLFEDNFFDLLPGEVKRVRVLEKPGRGMVRAKPFFSSGGAEVVL